MKQYQLKAERLHLTSIRRSYRPVVIFAATVEPQEAQRTSQLFGQPATEDVSEKGADTADWRLGIAEDLVVESSSQHTSRQAHKSSAVKWRKMSDRAIRMACWSRSEVRNISYSKEMNGGGYIQSPEEKIGGYRGVHDTYLAHIMLTLSLRLAPLWCKD